MKVCIVLCLCLISNSNENGNVKTTDSSVNSNHTRDNNHSTSQLNGNTGSTESYTQITTQLPRFSSQLHVNQLRYKNGKSITTQLPTTTSQSSKNGDTKSITTTKLPTTTSKLSTVERSPLISKTSAFNSFTTTKFPFSCVDSYPPTLEYHDYVIVWNIDQSNPDCIISKVNLTCEEVNTSDTWNILSVDSQINTLNKTYNFTEAHLYHCSARVIYKNNESSHLSNKLLIPPQSKNRTITFDEPNLFWNAPFKNVTTILYNISIKPLQANHYIPIWCENDNNSFDVVTNETNYTFVNRKADFTYQISESTTFWGFNDFVVENFITKSSEPGKPTNISVEAISTTNGEIYKLQWTMPCNPNGEISGYEICLSDGKIVRNVTCEATKQDNYSYNFSALKPNTFYTVFLRTIGKNTLFSSSVFHNFTTNDEITDSSVNSKYTRNNILFASYKNGDINNITSTQLPTTTSKLSTVEQSPLINTSAFDSSTTTKLPFSCVDSYPPTLEYHDYVIVWNIDQSNPDCIISKVNLTCEEVNTSDTWNILSVDSQINTLNKTYNFTEAHLYHCSARVIFKNNESSHSSNKLLVPPRTENQTITFDEPNLYWNAPFKNVTTIFYNISIKHLQANHYIPIWCEDDNNSFDMVTNETNYTFVTRKADFTYQISESTTFWGFNDSVVENFITKSSEPGKPTNISVEAISTTNGEIYKLQWTMPCNPNGEISGYEICLSDGKIVRNVTCEATKQDNYSYNFSALKPNTFYTVFLRTIGKNTLFSSSVFHNFTTNDEIPMAPILNIESVGSNFITINWSMDSVITITNYTLTVNYSRPSYNRSNTNCLAPKNILPIFIEASDTTYNITKLWPSSIYEISLTASSSKGQGPPGIKQGITNFSEPEAPYNFLLSVGEADEDNKVAGYLTWKEPCQLNGKLLSYLIHLSEQYTEDTNTITKSNWSTTDKFLNLTLKPSHNYFANIAIQLEDGTIGNFTNTSSVTPVGFPGVPELEVTSIFNDSFSMKWQPPIEKTGPIKNYILVVNENEIIYDIPNDCNKPKPYYINESLPNIVLEYHVVNTTSYTSYNATLMAVTAKGVGHFNSKNITTLPAPPEKVRDIVISFDNILNENYTATAIIEFSEPCHMNGIFQSYTLEYTGTRDGYPTINNNTVIDSKNVNENKPFRFQLSPKYSYMCSIITKNKQYSIKNDLDEFISPAGVPNFSVVPSDIPVENLSPDQVQIVLKKEFFDQSQGDVEYVALILSNKPVDGPSIDKWNGSWPSPFNGGKQITTKFWNPFYNNSDNALFTIGSGSPGNPPLETDRVYYLCIRIFTNNFYRDSSSIIIKIDKISRLGTIIGVISAILILAVLGILMFFVWRKKLYRKFPYIYSKKLSVRHQNETNVPVKKFISYVKSIDSNSEIIKQQFDTLLEKSKEIQQSNSTNFATLLENKRKNRYINILPYDASRVKLLIDEDDEIGSDYINASYIKGYSGEVEYIATQGPLATTCKDFWRMVIQENVTIIAMVSNFVENNKQKCHKYFPENRENLIVGDNMEIRCATELHFGTYVIRNLQVRKDSIQITVTHMQFLEWPDFGVPVGTDHMLQFIYQMRERVKLEGGLIIVHCSAGVGRSGTLIAADILFQMVNAGKHIDIFQTVLELRKQRVTMVQTKDQYQYIHNLIAEHIDRPVTPDSTEGPDPVYENMDIIKKPNKEYEKIKTEGEEESRF